jgi:hypothetical protein
MFRTSKRPSTSRTHEEFDVVSKGPRRIESCIGSQRSSWSSGHGRYWCIELAVLKWTGWDTGGWLDIETRSFGRLWSRCARRGSRRNCGYHWFCLLRGHNHVHICGLARSCVALTTLSPRGKLDRACYYNVCAIVSLRQRQALAVNMWANWEELRRTLEPRCGTQVTWDAPASIRRRT